MTKKWISCALTLGLLATTAVFPVAAQNGQASTETAVSARPEIAKYARAYSGAFGVQVLTLRVGPREAQEYIVQIVGVDHDWDEQLRKLHVERVRDEQRFMLKGKSEDASRLILNLDDSGRGYLHLPGEPAPLAIGYDRDLSQRINPEHFLSAYLQAGN